MQHDSLTLLGTADYDGDVHEDLYVCGDDLFIVVRRPGMSPTSLIRLLPSEHDTVLQHF